MAVTAQGVEVLRLADVWKSFDGVDALKGVTFGARAGEIHALLGENGAGKSTLMAIAAGSLAPDRGQVELGGDPVRDATPAAIRQRGLSIAYQHPALVPDLTVYENVAMWLPRQVRAAGKGAASWMRAQLARVGCRADLAQRVSSLGVAQRHLLEIAKAMASDPAVLILDEPTAALGADDSGVLFAELRRLAGDGVAVVYITHRLAEVRELCQQVTVLRDGSIRGTHPVGDITDAELLELIVGRAVTAEFPPKPAERPGGEPVLAARGLSARAFHDVTLAAAPGEIVGLAGIVGNGQSEFLRALAGLGRASGGSTVLNGKPLKPGRPDAALDAGVVYLSADRLGEGLFGTLSVRENALISTLGQFSRLGVTRLGEEARAVEAQRASLSIRAASVEANVLSLSGGNQQKVLLTRALLNQEVALLLAEEPTQGVDVGARAEIYRILRQVAAAGAAVIIVSSDIRELEGLCDRVAVFSAGHVVAELAGGEVREDAIAHAMMTSTRRRQQATSEERKPVRAAAPLAARASLAPGSPRRGCPGPGDTASRRRLRRLRGPRRRGDRARRLHAGAQLPVPVRLQPELADGADRRPGVHLLRAGVRDPHRRHRPVGGAAGRPGRGDRLVLREQRAQPGGADRRVRRHDRRQRGGGAVQRGDGLVRQVHPHRRHAGHLHRPAGHLAGAAPVPGRVHLVLHTQRRSTAPRGRSRSRSSPRPCSRSPSSGGCTGPAGAGACGRSARTRPPRSGSASGRGAR